MRKVHFVLSVLVLAAVVLQFYLAGVGVFSMPDDELFGLHTANGRFVVSALLLINIPAAALARGRTLRYALGLVGLLALQTVIFVIAIVTTGSNPFENVAITTAGTVILSFHVPLAAAPDLPFSAASGVSGRKLPTNGAEPCAIRFAAESSMVVLDVAGVHALPKLFALPPFSMLRGTTVLSGPTRLMVRSASKVCVR